MYHHNRHRSLRRSSLFDSRSWQCQAKPNYDDGCHSVAEKGAFCPKQYKNRNTAHRFVNKKMGPVDLCRYNKVAKIVYVLLAFKSVISGFLSGNASLIWPRIPFFRGIKPEDWFQIKKPNFASSPLSKGTCYPFSHTLTYTSVWLTDSLSGTWLPAKSKSRRHPLKTVLQTHQLIVRWRHQIVPLPLIKATMHRLSLSASGKAVPIHMRIQKTSMFIFATIM